MPTPAFESIDTVSRALADLGYIPDRSLATTVFLAVRLGRPIFLEGEPGVGKTALAQVLSDILGTELIRLQCYEGLDSHTALYEWNYPRQMLHLKVVEGRGIDPARLEASIFGREYLLERPLLRAITREAGPAVLLIDEIDRADDGFEAFLLEILSEFQVTVPELGTIRASHPPHVVLTSNHSREIGDALRRRCLYLYIEHPSLEKEVRIIRARVPRVLPRLAGEVGRFVQALRERPLAKLPGVAETLDWTHALLKLRVETLDPEVVGETLGCLLKERRDLAEVRGDGLASLVERARGEATA
jgi:MoxR-like ATPase